MAAATETTISPSDVRPGDRVYVSLGEHAPQWLTVADVNPRGDLTYDVTVADPATGLPVDLDRSAYRVERADTTTLPTRCRRCHRPLKNPRSVRAEYGPGCARLIRGELADYSPEQTAKAVRVVRSGGVARLRGGVDALYAVTGTYRQYWTDGIDCTCAGMREHASCYHAEAVRIYSLAA